MRYKDISAPMRRFIGGWEALRKLGFEADSIFCNIARSVELRGKLACFVHLKAQGKEFKMFAGEVTDGELFSAEYLTVTAAMNKGEIPQEDMDRIWQESDPFQDKLGFMGALLEKGFRVPKQLS